MLKFSRTEPIDFLKYEEMITSEGYIYVDPTSIPNHLAYDESLRDTMVELALREMVADGGYLYGTFNKDTIIDYLLEVAHVPEEKLMGSSSSSSSYSLESKKVLLPLKNSGYAVDFLDLYIKQSSLKYIVSRIKGMFSRLTSCGDISKDGVELERLNYSVRQRDNLRYNYRGEDIISVPKSYTKTYTVPEGYFLAWGDLKQSDFRIACNLLIIDETNYKYFEGSDDWYRSMYQILCDFHRRPYNEEEFSTRREIMKVNCLSTIYGATKGESEEDTIFVQEFSKYLDRCPRYKEFKERIKQYQDHKVPITITSYFGNSIPVTGEVHTEDEVSYYVSDKGTKLTHDSVLTQALNTPFQTGTSEIVIKTVTAILEMFYSLGYTEKDVRVYVVRHDEPVFMIHEKVIKDSWVFENSKEIYVDSWQPLGLDFSYGYYYGEEDIELTERINKSITDSIYKVEYKEPDRDFVPYIPLKRFRRYSIGYESVDKELVLASIFNEEDNQAVYYILKSNKVEIEGELVEVAAWQAAAKHFEENSESYLKEGIEDILIDSEFKFPPQLLQSSIILIANKSVNASSKAKALASCKAWAYCENNEKIFPGDLEIVSANKDFADGVERVEFFKVSNV